MLSLGHVMQQGVNMRETQGKSDTKNLCTKFLLTIMYCSYVKENVISILS